MICQFCGSRRIYVVDSRYHSQGYHRRRYRCVDCSCRFTTYETTIRPYIPDAAKKRASNLPRKLREAAREEAKETGEDVATILERWR